MRRQSFLDRGRNILDDLLSLILSFSLSLIFLYLSYLSLSLLSFSLSPFYLFCSFRATFHFSLPLSLSFIFFVNFLLPLISLSIMSCLSLYLPLSFVLSHYFLSISFILSVILSLRVSIFPKVFSVLFSFTLNILEYFVKFAGQPENIAFFCILSIVGLVSTFSSF